jgi:hypothetical protein
MFYTEWITKDYLLVNISMLHLENLDEWILKQMPEVEHLEFYGDIFSLKTMLPSSRDKDRWNKFQCKYIDISYEDTYTILYKARKQKPEKPTIAFLETREFQNTFARDRWLAENPQ